MVVPQNFRDECTKEVGNEIIIKLDQITPTFDVFIFDNEDSSGTTTFELR